MLFLKVLPVVDGSIWVLTYYNNSIAVMLFLPLILLSGEIFSVFKICMEASFHYWGLMVLSGIIGFAIGTVTGLQIKVRFPFLAHLVEPSELILSHGCRV